jgi:rhodanese-related sulfurtransferase
VRPAQEYEAGHLAEAIAMPLEELERHLAELPRDVPIVAYCSGPYCVLAVSAVETLRRHGFDAVRAPEGVQEWRELGLKVIREDG